MPKKSYTYLEVDPYKIIEKGFHRDRDQVSESLFSLGNEYSGIRGFFEEGYSGKKLIGSYFNGIYDYALEETPNAYKGIVKRTHFTINSINWVKCSIIVDDEVLDLNISNFKDFYRELDFKNGLYTRSFTWITHLGELKIKFERLLNMTYCHQFLQKITFSSNTNIPVTLKMDLDNTILHWNSDCYWKRKYELIDEDIYGLEAETLTTKQKLISAEIIDSPCEPVEKNTSDRYVSVKYNFVSTKKTSEFTRYVINIVDKFNKISDEELLYKAKDEVKNLKIKGFDNSLLENTNYFKNIWNKSDIIIEGDDKDQQGIRYCIFQLEQTYHGYEKDNNIGAKGLTGEAYSGHAFWDSETYCLPYYLFSNKEASKNLLMFRYNTLNEARERAKELDCRGACYPVATRNGKEGCNLWQHASLQFQPSTGVFYAIYHYMNLYNDKQFMQNYGIEMLIEICKFLLSRGQYNQDHSGFGFYGVMGPDEFEMMVNNNTYTNFMAKKAFDYLLELYKSKNYDFSALLKKCDIDESFFNSIHDASNKMIILYNKKTHVFEQHEGFFSLPHIDINKIPTSDFPLYSHWSYDRIYRNDMIKQPDVLMFMFLFNQDFTFDQKKCNYEYYEPRCIHESSLSPSIHSIFASELKKYDDASKFFNFATRLDLDDYNCNTLEGIHMTSIAAAWMNIVYGFGGLRSDKSELLLNPSILPNWKSYSFKITYHGTIINIKVTDKETKLIIEGDPVKLKIYDKEYTIKDFLTIER